MITNPKIATIGSGLVELGIAPLGGMCGFTAVG